MNDFGAAESADQLTVLMPVFNGERYLEEQIESILDQSLRQFRLIILDDCSTDQSGAIVRRYVARDPRVSVQTNSANLGVIASVERLLGMVTTPFFSLADQDDVWHPDKLQESLTFLRSTNAELVCTNLELVDAELRPLGSTLIQRIGAHPNRLRGVTPLLVRNIAVGCTLVGTKALAQRCLPFPKAVYMHDWWMALVAASQNRFRYLDRSLVRYRQHGGNLLGADTGIGGLRRRLAVRDRGLDDHLRDRLHVRLTFIRALKGRSLCGPSCVLVGAFWSLPVAFRLLLCPLYAGFLFLLALPIGCRAILVDVALTSMPAWVARAVERTWN